MKDLYRQYRKQHIWLLGALVSLGAFRLLRGQRGLMNALERWIIAPLRRLLGWVCYQAPFSVMELLGVLLVLAAAGYLLWSIAAVVRGAGQRRRRAYQAVLGAVCGGLTLWSACCWMWGISHWTDSFQDRSGIRAQPVALKDLRAVTAYFAARVGETAGQVKRDEKGLFAVPREEILDASVQAYDGLEDAFPFLSFEDPGVKPLAFSRLLSSLDFTGFYCAFTGESNVNVDSPACMLPATAAHELAHQRGYGSEQECNFLSVLASTTCGEPAYVYSGWLIGYVYLGNALYPKDPESYLAIRDTLPETARLDLAYNNAYWAQFRDTAARRASNRIYDGILKQYGDQRGMQSYGAAVDLLVAYYREAAGREKF